MENLSNPRTPLEALKVLVQKLEQIEASEDYKAVWALAQVHGYFFTKPSWEHELEQAKMVLSDFEDTIP